MPASETKSLPSIGFLTIRRYQDLGRIGGYLVLNTNGRPLEFHCTAPVRPNRAQEILYGPTLEPFLCAEQIGRALVAKSKHKAEFICTDIEAVLALREFIKQPVVFLTTQNDSTNRRVDAAHQDAAPHLGVFEFAGTAARVSPDQPGDQQRVIEQWSQGSGVLDLLEPFSRLSEAIDETQSGANR